MIVQAFVLLSLISVKVLGITQPCYETYLAKNGHQCLQCDVGYHKVSDCIIDGTQSECRRCMNGTYMPSCSTATRCKTCRLDCPDRNQVKVKNCKAVSDIECQCKIGYFWKPIVIGPNHGQCKPYQTCKEGHGVVEKGTPSADTKCVPCENGLTYSNSSSFDSCIPCSSCNTFIETQCTAFNDTVCGEQQPKPQKEIKSAYVAIVSAVAFVVLAAETVLVVVCLCVRRMRSIEGKKPANVEQVLGNDYSPTNGETTHTDPRGDLSRSRDITTKHNTNGDKADPASGERQNDPAKNGTDSFNVNQAFDPDPVDNLKMKKSKGKDGVIFYLKTGNSSSNQLQLRCSYTKKIRRNLENINDEEPDELPYNQGDNCSKNSNKLCQNKGMHVSQCGTYFTNDEDSLFKDTDLTVDASAVAPRTLPPQVEGNSKQPEEAGFDGTVRCGDGPVNFLGQEREDPVDLSDIATAATETNRTEETRQSTFWFEVIDFLQRMMLFKDFIMFARRLANNTNKEFFKIIDVVIENSGEGNERKYQILKRWREATPNAQLKDVIDAMKFYHHNVLCAELLNQLIDENLLDADDDLLGTVTAQSGNDNSLYPGIGLSIQDADIYIEENDLAYGGHLEMEYLKSFKC